VKKRPPWFDLIRWRLIEIKSRKQQTRRTLLDWLRVEYAVEKPSNKLLAVADLDSDNWAGEVKRIRGKELPLTAAGVHALRDEYTRTIEPTRALAAETLDLERTLSDLVNQAYGLTPAEIELTWKTAPPRMPIPPPATDPQAPVKEMARPDSAGLARGPAALSGLSKPDAGHRRD
jgi:hypothetical protein